MEMDYRPRKAKKTYRMIVLRKTIRVTQGQLRLGAEVRYFFYVTNIEKSRLSTAAVVRENNARCQQENVIEQLKNGVQATRLPVREFYANWTYLVIAALAWNIKAWAGLLLPEEMGARALLRMEFRRFLNEIVRLPAQILKTGRRLVFRLLEINRWTVMLLEGTQRLNPITSSMTSSSKHFSLSDDSNCFMCLGQCSELLKYAAPLRNQEISKGRLPREGSSTTASLRVDPCDDFGGSVRLSSRKGRAASGSDGLWCRFGLLVVFLYRARSGGGAALATARLRAKVASSKRSNPSRSAVDSNRSNTVGPCDRLISSIASRQR